MRLSISVLASVAVVVATINKAAPSTTASPTTTTTTATPTPTTTTTTAAPTTMTTTTAETLVPDSSDLTASTGVFNGTGTPTKLAIWSSLISVTGLITLFVFALWFIWWSWKGSPTRTTSPSRTTAGTDITPTPLSPHSQIQDIDYNITLKNRALRGCDNAIQTLLDSSSVVLDDSTTKWATMSSEEMTLRKDLLILDTNRTAIIQKLTQIESVKSEMCRTSSQLKTNNSKIESSLKSKAALEAELNELRRQRDLLHHTN